jgi:hypothetical protein
VDAAALIRKPHDTKDVALADRQEGVSESLQALNSICEHKRANPAGTLSFSKSEGMVSILAGRDAPDDEVTFAVPEWGFDQLVAEGYLQLAPQALTGDQSRKAFEITDAGWDMCRTVED